MDIKEAWALAGSMLSANTVTTANFEESYPGFAAIVDSDFNADPAEDGDDAIQRIARTAFWAGVAITEAESDLKDDLAPREPHLEVVTDAPHASRNALRFVVPGEDLLAAFADLTRQAPITIEIYAEDPEDEGA
jgi:hypothetical protein